MVCEVQSHAPPGAARLSPAASLHTSSPRCRAWATPQAPRHPGCPIYLLTKGPCHTGPCSQDLLSWLEFGIMTSRSKSKFCHKLAIGVKPEVVYAEQLCVEEAEWSARISHVWWARSGLCRDPYVTRKGLCRKARWTVKAGKMDSQAVQAGTPVCRQARSGLCRNSSVWTLLLFPSCQSGSHLMALL